MTGAELIAELDRQGTGAAKLAPARALLESNPDAPIDELIEAMRSGGAAEGTLAKIETILNIKLRYSEEGATTDFPVRAPIGGIKLGQRDFVPGEIIPPEVLETIKPDDVKLLCAERNDLSLQKTDPNAPARGRRRVQLPEPADESKADEPTAE